MTERVIVIGAGHNGLVCAAYLARAGREVLVVEAAGQPGGAAVTREFAPGFRVSAVAHLLYGLDAGIAQEMALGRHGLVMARSGLKTVALNPDGPALVLDGAEVVAGAVTAQDLVALGEYWRRLQRFAAMLGRQNARVPPRLAWASPGEAWPAARLALDLRRLGRADMREFLRIAAINIFDVLEETFETPLLKGALAMDGVLGTYAGPRSNNTVLAALQRLSGSAAGLALPRGGMGAVADAMASAARASGAQIRLDAPVASILLNGDRVSGVRLASGEELAAGAVVSGVDPKTTLLGLLGARHLEAGFARRIDNVRMQGTAAKLHLALSDPPQFTGVPAACLGERLLLAPDLDYIERAFNPAKYREFSPAPVMEITVPSIHDPTLAPAGQHVLSAIVQYAPHDLDGGWDQGRSRLLEVALGVLERYAPGLRRQIVAAQLLTPADIGQQLRLAGGHWHHGELALDQFLVLRPVPGAAQYAMPVGGLYLCGAGCHPGGGVMGHAGRNAARVILAAGGPA